MSNFISRRVLSWLGFLFILALVAMSAGACSCDDAPLIQEQKPEVKKEVVATDGGMKEVLPEGNASCHQRCDCPQGEECDLVTHTCIIPEVPVYCCDRDHCPLGMKCVDSQGNEGVCSERKRCKNNCDCAQGLACKEGFCVKESLPVYCCEKQGCPAGEKCFSARGGSQVCGEEGFVCFTSCDCLQGLSCVDGRCAKSENPVYCCERKDCPEGKACQTAQGDKGVCGKFQKCRVTCDCPTGQACIKGRCLSQDVPVYCCDRVKECPADQICETLDGKRQKCPKKAECQQHCDCPQGQYCDKGQCLVGTSPVYCCAKQGCPPKAACFNKDGSIGTCHSPKCQKDSDCGAPSCKQRGTQCAQATPRCQKDGNCRNEILNVKGICEPKKGQCRIFGRCLNHCDCPQGQRCEQGSCLASPIPTFCCDRAGCPKGQACFHKDGSAGICQQNNACKVDSDCGASSCQQLATDCRLIQPMCDKKHRCVATTKIVRFARCQGGKCLTQGPPKCKVHCDCPQGQACMRGRCLFVGKPVFCCDKPACPASESCYKRDNTVAVCPNTKKCHKDSDCGKSSCLQRGRMCVERVPRCDVRTGVCKVAETTSQGICHSSTGKCQAPKSCHTACDCPQGQSCLISIPKPGALGTCVSSPKGYCCDKPGCPSGLACETKMGQRSHCPVKCQSPCDCKPGQDCIKGTCTSVKPPVYCCNDPQHCPAGAQCKDKIGALSKCPQKPRMCQSPCDCIQGEACLNHVCVKSSQPVYCCNKANCPAGKACLDKNNRKAVCPRPCKQICDCEQGERCVQGFCTMRYGKGYCCDKPGCPSGFYCFDKNNHYRRCPLKTCKNACDCPQGLDCRNNVCIPVNPPIYCCDKSNCPSNQICITRKGKWGTCNGGKPMCKSLCDCPTGQDCYKGQCVRVYPPVYCCTDSHCPPGQTCYDKNYKVSTCPGKQCTSPCDCFQGYNCIRGRCVRASIKSYCCEHPSCPAGAVCEHINGKLGVCPGKKCQSPCDCNQGEDCRGGACIRVYPPVYCCNKSGCRAGQPCIDKNGSSALCKVECRSNCDCPRQQMRCFAGNCYPSRYSYCCDKPNCPAGMTCVDKKGMSSFCKGKVRSCKVRCDCLQGEDCLNGKCIRRSFPVYCCDKPACPPNKACLDKKNQSGLCPAMPWP